MEIDSSTETDPDLYLYSLHTRTYNGLNDYGNYGNYGNYANSNNLYNPMINRGFQNSNSNRNSNNNSDDDFGVNNDDPIYTLHNYLLALNINTSSNITIEYGLNKKELKKNSTIIECHTATDCPICLCNYPQHTYFYLMKCNHTFCIDCCETWFSKNSLCPLCRKNYK